MAARIFHAKNKNATSINQNFNNTIYLTSVIQLHFIFFLQILTGIDVPSQSQQVWTLEICYMWLWKIKSKEV
jgi:hypothetical protein